ncbi:MAG: VCBS repeat-containing protein, partial [Eubacterium sp.]|nr:VCBS repeat-containing protein [Eubacterium sp.]
VQNAVDEYCKSGYLIKIPSSGDYTTSFIFYDLDGDGVDEAVSFFEPSDDRGTVSLAVLKKTNGKWNVIDNIKGDGTDVKSVDFSDVNNDGQVEILVCWNVIAKSTNSKLGVYNQTQNDEGYKLEQIDDSITAGEFICADMNNDGINEVVIFNIGSSAESPTAELYSFADNSKRRIGRTKLDSTIISFENIIAAETVEGMSIYADALKADGSSMVTEFLYWSNYYDSIVSPFYSYSSGKTAETARSSIINSKDIDSDGEVEIPVDAKADNLPKQITAQNWLIYKNTVLNHKCYTYSCKRDSYSLLVDDDLFDDVIVRYDNDNRMMTVVSKDSEKEYFSIIAVISSAYNPNELALQGYTEIFTNSGFVYLAKVNTQAQVSFTIDDLKNMIKSY